MSTDWQKRLAQKPKRGHSEVELDITGVRGSEFRVLLRRSNFNPLDFSVILAYRFPDSNQVLRLRRYNGKSHQHRNPDEQHAFYDFHIHTATERCQSSGNREDSFAEPTDRYADLDSALQCLFRDCGFEIPEDPQGKLF